ncbi:MAG: DUF1987 domain-containing protein [Bacteroidales bacterium]|nr:DUF1987 domain-containing protein [Bacteroidales bacterium]
MEKKVIHEPLKNCPGIFFYPENNYLEIKGRSIPEDPEMFYRCLDSWVSDYFSANRTLNVKIQLEYINSSSARLMYEFLYKLKGFYHSGKQGKIKWICEQDDDEMRELGENYRDSTGVPVEIEVLQ